jgi:hypothetical protein
VTRVPRPEPGHPDGVGGLTASPDALTLAGRATSRVRPGTSGEAALSEDATAGTGTGTDDAVLLFVGGPLDGRVEIRAARHGEPLPTVTHVHLHGGPKVVHRYDLESLAGGVGVYNLRQPARRSSRDGSVAD